MGQAQSQSLGGDCSSCYGSVDGGGSYIYGMNGNADKSLLNLTEDVAFFS